MKSAQAAAEVFFTAFKALTTGERDAFIGKVVSDPQLREDLIDAALIEESKKAKGKSVSAKEYFPRKCQARSAHRADREALIVFLDPGSSPG